MHRLLFFLFLLIICNHVWSQQPGETAADSTTIVFASDTQAPMWVETLFLKSNNNRHATQKLFEELADKKPKSVFLLGDVVNLGYSNKQWKAMAGYLATLRKKGISVHAALGNHEVMGQAKKGEKKFQTYFPDHVRTGYVKVVDSVAVVLLNSNFGKLSTADNALQEIWFSRTLDSLDKDPSIHFIISGCHHSPFTNSKIVGCSKDVEDKFVTAFLRSAKSRLFVSGHSHNFEHFKKEGKDFFVIGGGGGLHQPLNTGPDCLTDIDPDYKPDFHYLTVKRSNDNLTVISYQLKKDFTMFVEGRRFEVKKIQSDNMAGTNKH